MSGGGRREKDGGNNSSRGGVGVEDKWGDDVKRETEMYA